MELHRGWQLLLCLAVGLVCPTQAETLRVGGTGSAEPLLRVLFQQFSQQAPDAKLRVVSPPLGSSGGVNALASGRIDLAVVSRPLSPSEVALLGRNFEWARTPFVLAANQGQRASGFTLDELASVYAGRLLKWDDGSHIRLVLRTPDDSDTSVLASISPRMASGLALAQQRPGMTVGVDDLDTLMVLARTSGTLGSTTLGLLRTTAARLSVLPINGVMPSAATLKRGEYPWHKTFTVALPTRPSALAQGFADFLRTEAAHAVLLHYEYLPAGP